MELYQRIKAVIDHFCNGTTLRFAQKMGAKESTCRNYLHPQKSRAIKISFLDAVLTRFPEVSREWLFFGEGEMLDAPKDMLCEPKGVYYAKYCDERDRAVAAEREALRAERAVVRAEKSMLAEQKRARELADRLRDQQERILHAVTVELHSQNAPQELIVRVQAAIIDYSATAGMYDQRGRAITDPGDAGASRPQEATGGRAT